MKKKMLDVFKSANIFFFVLLFHSPCYFVAGHEFRVTGFNMLAFWRPRLFKSHTIGRFIIFSWSFHFNCRSLFAYTDTITGSDYKNDYYAQESMRNMRVKR